MKNLPAQILFFVAIFSLLLACTVSVNMTDTHGRGTHDVGEESTDASNDLEAEIPVRV